MALAFCLGNFQQMVRNLHLLLSGEPTALRAGPTAPLSTVAPGLLDWAARADSGPFSSLAVIDRLVSVTVPVTTLRVPEPPALPIPTTDWPFLTVSESPSGMVASPLAPVSWSTATSWPASVPTSRTTPGACSTWTSPTPP